MSRERPGTAVTSAPRAKRPACTPVSLGDAQERTPVSSDGGHLSPDVPPYRVSGFIGAVAYHHGAARAVRAAIAGRPMPRLSRFRARAGREVQRDRPGHPAPGHRAQRPHARGRRGRAHLPAFRGPRPGLWLALRCPAKATMDKQCLEPEDIGRLRSSVGHRLQLRGARAETSYCCGRTSACSGFVH